MTPERWGQVNEVFHSALEREPAERAAFLDQACDGDEELRREVVSLIGSHEDPDSFIDVPALEAAAQSIADDPGGFTAGQRIGHYKIVSLLGSGGMGEVYLAQDLKLGRKVALKLLPASFTQVQERVRRFEQEARAASALNHPNILTIHEVDQVDGIHFIATEYIEGDTLRQRIIEQGLRLGEAIDVAIEVAGALAAAHQAGIIHRDIKPENIMLRSDGYVKVLDFGLAKLTEREPTVTDTQSPTIGAVKTDTGAVMGTAHYMSPEQARGGAVDERTDIFSLGVVIYEMVTAHVPFEGETASHVIVSILEKEPPPLSDYFPKPPAELQRIVSKALSKNREERYQAVKDLLIDLKTLRREFDLDAASIKAVARTGRPVARTASNAKYLMAVLPFKPIMEQSRDEALELGMADALIARLSASRKLIVRPLSSVRRYGGLEQDSQAAGRELGVESVLDGSLQRSADRIRLTARLINVVDGASLWVGTFDEKATDVFAVQDAISERVVDALALPLSNEERQRLTKRSTENLEAYDLYLKGRYYWNKLIPREVRKSIQFFQQAIDLDPTYALAYAGMAEAYRSFPINSDVPPDDAFPLAHAAAAKALEIDGTLADVHATLSILNTWYDWDWAGAEREAKRALALNPNSSEAHRANALLLSTLGSPKRCDRGGGAGSRA